VNNAKPPGCTLGSLSGNSISRKILTSGRKRVNFKVKWDELIEVPVIGE
jgi:hypothetical protein